MTIFGADPLDAHLGAVQIVADAGAGTALPQQWPDLRARLEHYLSAPSEIPQRLADAVIDGTDDIAELTALALA